MRVLKMNRVIEEFFTSQIAEWPLAADNFAAFDTGIIKERTITVDGQPVLLQFNPARIRSTAADIGSSAIRERACFLCRKNRPAEQKAIEWGGYDILVNPYPIFRRHLTISAKEHTPQLISGRYADMLALADYLEDYVVFYNGARCGASAPDHFHFQAGPKGVLPLETDLRTLPCVRLSTSLRDGSAQVYELVHYLAGAYVIETGSRETSERLFYEIVDSLPGDYSSFSSEPMMNVLSWKDGDDYVTVLVPRQKHRPSCFSEYMVTPASVELGGLVVLPREQDWERMDSSVMEQLLHEVCLPLRQPLVKVGLLSAQEINIEFSSMYRTGSGTVCGYQHFSFRNGKVVWEDREYDRVDFFPLDERNGCFSLMMKIGVAFHWERHERQVFQGGVSIVPVPEDGSVPAQIIAPGAPGMLTVINNIGVEDYLTSVISSEMNSAASAEFLKAHAIISRSWLMTRMAGTPHVSEDTCSEIISDDKLLRWYDRDDHTLFDVCADDHCQRYQGIIRVRNKKISGVIKETRGMVLKYDGHICDARYSKCCGGVSEQFENCWRAEHKGYLTAVRDCSSHDQVPDLTREENAVRWIMEAPEAFCRTSDQSILTSVLNNYDQETTDFYRWKVKYSQNKLSELVRDKSGIDFGQVTDLIPLKRGTSGRICELKIEGTLRTITVGKELEIRRWLSPSHLYSSAFVVEKQISAGGGITFILHGAGWGHGVGLCQIGAAVMGEKGYTYDRILLHYFSGASIETLY